MIARAEGNEGGRAYVAEEFMTWLWWQCETSGGVFELPHGDAVNVAIEDDLLLRGENQSAPEGQLRGGVPTRSSEAAAALAAGKRLARAKLVLATHDREWTVTLDAESYQFRSARVPQPDGGIDRDLEAFLGFEELADAIDTLFGMYLRERLSPRFATDVLPGMRQWIAGKVQRELRV